MFNLFFLASFCMAAAFLCRLNFPAIQIANHLVGPLQLGLLIPFYRAGEILFNRAHLPISVNGIVAMIEKDVWGAIAFLWDTTMCAVVIWMAVAPIMTLLLYSLFGPAIRKLPFDPLFWKAIPDKAGIHATRSWFLPF